MKTEQQKLSVQRRDFAKDYQYLRGYELMSAFLKDIMPGELALVSSFGAESAILLHMVSRIAPDTPVIFLETGKLFEQTLSYKEQLIKVFGLSNVQSAYPNGGRLGKHDPKGRLWQQDPDMCCHIRKTLPLQEALQPFSGWITGRKHYQSKLRAMLPAIEDDGDQIKLNPLIDYTPEDIRVYFEQHNLPKHPLFSKGYKSIGCEPCTAKSADNGNVRSGRWQHAPNKTECGIHIEGGKVIRIREDNN